MSEYPNIDMMLRGGTSGSTQEWPVLRKEADHMLSELSRLRAELAAERERADDEKRRADEAEARLHEGDFVDEFGTTWTRPTGWAYRMVCRDAEAAQAEVERAHGPHFVPGIQAMARVNAKFREERDAEKARADNAVAVMDVSLAQAAEMRRALEKCAEWLEDDGRNIHIQNEAAEALNAALALSPGEALAKHDERVRREAKIAALEALPCGNGWTGSVYCFSPLSNGEKPSAASWCHRCRALDAARKGEK